MKVVITYDNGRVDVFDDGRFTAAQPFGSNAMLANYELRFDRLGQTGLWLCIHLPGSGAARFPGGDAQSLKEPRMAVPARGEGRGFACGPDKGR